MMNARVKSEEDEKTEKIDLGPQGRYTLNVRVLGRKSQRENIHS